VASAAEVQYGDLIGVPFVKGGRTLRGLDCYGLVREMYRRWYGVELPNYEPAHPSQNEVALILSGLQQWERVTPVEGSMALFKLTSTLHTGFVLPYGRLIHTWDQSGGVCVERLSDWKHRIMGCYVYRG
jgi:cell wall-associated NlpC family hydrolase